MPQEQAKEVLLITDGAATISRSLYDSLMEDAALLNALCLHGVDNWEGYSDAVCSLEEE